MANGDGNQQKFEANSSIQMDMKQILTTQRRMVVALGVSGLLTAGTLVLAGMLYIKRPPHSHVFRMKDCTDTQCEGTDMFNHHQCSYAWCDQGVRCHLEECTQ